MRRVSENRILVQDWLPLGAERDTGKSGSGIALSSSVHVSIVFFFSQRLQRAVRALFEVQLLKHHGVLSAAVFRPGNPTALPRDRVRREV